MSKRCWSNSATPQASVCADEPPELLPWNCAACWISSAKWSAPSTPTICSTGSSVGFASANDRRLRLRVRWPGDCTISGREAAAAKPQSEPRSIGSLQKRHLLIGAAVADQLGPILVPARCDSGRRPRWSGRTSRSRACCLRACRCRRSAGRTGRSSGPGRCRASWLMITTPVVAAFQRLALAGEVAGDFDVLELRRQRGLLFLPLRERAVR